MNGWRIAETAGIFIVYGFAVSFLTLIVLSMVKDWASDRRKARREARRDRRQAS